MSLYASYFRIHSPKSHQTKIKPKSYTSFTPSSTNESVAQPMASFTEIWSRGRIILVGTPDSISDRRDFDGVCRLLSTSRSFAFTRQHYIQDYSQNKTNIGKLHQFYRQYFLWNNNSKLEFWLFDFETVFAHF